MASPSSVRCPQEERRKGERGKAPLFFQVQDRLCRQWTHSKCRNASRVARKLWSSALCLILSCKKPILSRTKRAQRVPAKKSCEREPMLGRELAADSSATSLPFNSHFWHAGSEPDWAPGTEITTCSDGWFPLPLPLPPWHYFSARKTQQGEAWGRRNQLLRVLHVSKFSRLVSCH